MQPVSRRIRLLLWIVLLAAFSAWTLAPPAASAAESLPIVLATATGPERLGSQLPWVDELARSITTYLTTQFPHEQLDAYTEAVDRLREAAQRGDRWRARRETGTLLKMLADRAHGLSPDAAQHLLDLAQQLMPEEEYGIVFPRGPHCGYEGAECP